MFFDFWLGANALGFTIIQDLTLQNPPPPWAFSWYPVIGSLPPPKSAPYTGDYLLLRSTLIDMSITQINFPDSIDRHWCGTLWVYT